MSPRVFTASFLLSATAAAVVAGSCTGTTPCDPAEYDLENATRLTPRELPGRQATPGPCTRPRTEVISTEADLRRLYEELGFSSADGDAAAGGAFELPAVDFSRERVVVREGPGNQGISWAVAKEDACILGLLSCLATRSDTSCSVNVIAVSATVTRVETRTCEPVRCGIPGPVPSRL